MVGGGLDLKLRSNRGSAISRQGASAPLWLRCKPGQIPGAANSGPRPFPRWGEKSISASRPRRSYCVLSASRPLFSERGLNKIARRKNFSERARFLAGIGPGSRRGNPNCARSWFLGGLRKSGQKLPKIAENAQNAKPESQISQPCGSGPPWGARPTWPKGKKFFSKNHFFVLIDLMIEEN